MSLLRRGQREGEACESEPRARDDLNLLRSPQI
jgi:hypothetical protein